MKKVQKCFQMISIFKAGTFDAKIQNSQKEKLSNLDRSTDTAIYLWFLE